MAGRWTVHYFEEVGSTQDTARELISHNVDVPFVVRAECQTNGRGRSGRSWSSLSGNILATMVVPMDFGVTMAANYSFLTALAVSSAVGAYAKAGANVEHKWPNDVWVNDRKIAGILLEIHKTYLLIGVGVNLADAPDGAIALAELSDKLPVPDVFLKMLFSKFDYYEQILRREGFGHVLDLWLEKARGIGQEIRVKTLIEEFHGVFDGLEPDGALRVLVHGEENPRIIRSADVFFGRK